MPFDAQDVGGHYSIVITSMSMLHFCEYAGRRVVGNEWSDAGI